MLIESRGPRKNGIADARDMWGSVGRPWSPTRQSQVGIKSAVSSQRRLGKESEGGHPTMSRRSRVPRKRFGEGSAEVVTRVSGNDDAADVTVT